MLKRHGIGKGFTNTFFINVCQMDLCAKIITLRPYLQAI